MASSCSRPISPPEQAAEQARAAAETRFRLAFTHSPVGMGMMDSAGRLLQVNPALSNMLGYSEQEFHGRTFADLVSPERQAEQRDRIARLFRGESEPSSAEWQFLRKDGSASCVILSLAPADGEVVGETLAVGHVQDISTQKQREDELRHSRERLAEAEHVAQMGSWEWDITNDRTTWSEGLFHVYGLTPDDRDPSFRGWMQRVYPDDRESSVEQSTKPSPNDHRSRSNTAPSALTAECTRCAAAERSSSTTRASRSGSLASRKTSPTPNSRIKSPEHIGRPGAPRHRTAAVGATHRDRATAHAACAAHSATARDFPTHRPRPHQRGDRRTTRRHREHGQMARQANPRQDSLSQPHRGRRPGALGHPAIGDGIRDQPFKAKATAAQTLSK